MPIEDALRGDAAVAGHELVDLREHRPCVAVVEIQAQPLGHLLDNPKVVAGFTGRSDGAMAPLHPPPGGSESAFFLSPGGGGQDHVGQLSRLGQEDVLHHQEVQRLQRLAHVSGVGIGEKRVLAHDVHGFDVTRSSGVHHLDHSETWTGG